MQRGGATTRWVSKLGRTGTRHGQQQRPPVILQMRHSPTAAPHQFRVMVPLARISRLAKLSSCLFSVLWETEFRVCAMISAYGSGLHGSCRPASGVRIATRSDDLG